MNESTRYHDILDLIRQAGEQILAVRGVNTEKQISEKWGDANFVTVFDMQIQRFLIGGLRALIPEAVFIAEEKENDGDALMADHCFIIDPIDGTTNFICDFHHSCISLAYLQRGEVVFGAVYNPYLREMFSAVRGEGAFCNGTPIHVSRRPFCRGLVMFGSSPYYKKELADQTLSLCRSLFLSCSDIRRSGSCALDLAYLAAGRVDVFFECRVSPWDIAAGMLLVSEAGGRLSDLEGNPLSYAAPTSILATNAVSYDDALSTIKSTQNG